MYTLPSLNYLAVAVAGLSTIVLGSIWYGPLFGKRWITLMGMTPEQIAAGKADKAKMNRSYLLALLGSLLTAAALACLMTYAMAYTQLSGLRTGLCVGLTAWIGFIVPMALGSVLWEGKSWALFRLNVAYYLVQLLIMGAILGSWR
jgi:hypothetical protein